MREAARLIHESGHNRLPVVEHGRLVGRGHAPGRARRPRPVTAPERALARIDFGAIERNCARLRSLLDAGTALCAVVKADALRARGGRGGRPRSAGGATWLAVATAAEAAELRGARHRRRAMLVMGALTAADAAQAASTRTPTWWPGRRARARPRAGAPRVHVKLDTGMGRLGTKDRGPGACALRWRRRRRRA